MRRQPPQADRKRDAERTREKILEAAIAEFGEHGYAGARVSTIAQRAGVNQQLISYYFDGKAGLYQALTERWQTLSAALNPADRPLTEVVPSFLARDPQTRNWARLLVWNGLTDHAPPGSPAPAPAAAAAAQPSSPAEASPSGALPSSPSTDDQFFAAMVDDIRRRQESGEISSTLDPALVLLILFSATLAPVVLPQVVRSMTGHEADSPEFLESYGDELRRIIERLG